MIQGLSEEQRVRTVGIIQEQHPERARLFMRWKGMDWPVLVDSLNLLGVSVVPITLFVDEHGIVRHVVDPRGPRREQLERFLSETYEPPEAPPAATTHAADLAALRHAAGEGGTEQQLDYGDALLLWGAESEIDEAAKVYRSAADAGDSGGRAEFRLGVLYRLRYDSVGGDPGDFGRAVESWSRALEIDPNNYIWRRRIQQFGPRLDKPYPFYDWVETARREIEARGGTPPALPVEPRGAEIARPVRRFDPANSGAAEPDGGGRIHRDRGKLVRVASTVVPPRPRPGGAARVHVELRPNRSADAHWNNEARGLVLWVDPPEDWDVDRQKIELANPRTAVSDEVRRVEFEVRSPASATGTAEVEAYALYYVCEKSDGKCLYRRQDVPIRIEVAAAAAP